LCLLCEPPFVWIVSLANVITACPFTSVHQFLPSQAPIESTVKIGIWPCTLIPPKKSCSGQPFHTSNGLNRIVGPTQYSMNPQFNSSLFKSSNLVLHLIHFILDASDVHYIKLSGDCSIEFSSSRAFQRYKVYNFSSPIELSSIFPIYFLLEIESAKG
jgi:hypothetical protein